MHNYPVKSDNRSASDNFKKIVIKSEYVPIEQARNENSKVGLEIHL